jgi:hypothetical protein
MVGVMQPGCKGCTVCNRALHGMFNTPLLQLDCSRIPHVVLHVPRHVHISLVLSGGVSQPDLVLKQHLYARECGTLFECCALVEMVEGLELLSF